MSESRFTFRKLFGKIHLWLGLLSGIILFVVCLTGTIFIFRFEIDKLLYPSAYYVNVTEKREQLPADSLVSILEHKYNGKLVDISIPARKDQFWEITLRSLKMDVKESYKFNPYNGAVIEVKNTIADDFFRVVYYLHTSFYLKNKVGELIVGISTIIFLIMILSGLVLWTRKKFRNIKQGLVLKRTNNWKRINYDLHNVLGFYTFLVLIIICLTGLTYTFASFDTFVNTIFSDKESIEAPSTSANTIADTTLHQTLPLSVFLKETDSIFQFKGNTIIFMPQDSDGYVKVRRFKTGFFAISAPDKLEFNQYNAKKVTVMKFSDYSLNEKILKLIYPLHSGKIFGTFSQIIYLLICLIATSLPLTGTIIWYNKSIRKRKKILPVKEN